MYTEGEVRQDPPGDQSAKAHSGRLLAITSTGPIRRVRVAGRALPIASVLAVLTELAERADGVDRPFRSTIAQRVEGEAAYEAWLNFYTPLSLGLLTLPAPGRLHVLFEILRHIKREDSPAGVEPLLASAINATWPLLSVECLETVVAIAKRHIDESNFLARHPISVSDATFTTTTFLGPGELQRIDPNLWIEEWRLQPTKNAWGMTDAAANDFLGRLGVGGGPAGTFGRWGGPGLPGSNNGDFGYGTPGGFGDTLGRLGVGGGPAGTFGRWGGPGLPGSNNGDFGYGTPGGFEGAFGRIGLGRGPFGAFELGANGGPTGFGAALGRGGAMHPEGDGLGHHMVDFATSTWKAVAAGAATTNAATKLVGGAALEATSGVAALVVLGVAGTYLVGSALAAAEDKSDEAFQKAWGTSTPSHPPPGDGQQGGGQQGGGQQGGHHGGGQQGGGQQGGGQQGGGQQGGGQQGGGHQGGGTGPDPKHHHEGDSYPDPDGSGGGPVDPTWIPAEDGPGSGGGHPLWSPANDGEEPPDPTMIWDENGGGGTPNTIGRGVALEFITGEGLLAGVIQIGPRTFRFT